MLKCKDLEELMPAYVLDAVDEAQRVQIESHLKACPKCAQLAECYRPVVDLLPFAAEPVEPPPDLKYRVLAAMSAEAPRAARVPSRSQPSGSVLAWLAGLWSAPTLSAAALILVIALGFMNLNLQGQVAQQAAFTRQVANELSTQRDFVGLIAYSDTQPRHLQGAGTATQAVGRLYGAADERSFALIAYDMPQLPSDRVYQLWLIDSKGNRTSGGTFSVDSVGRGWLFARAPNPLNQYQAVGVTVEPEGGSPGPTGAKMMGGNL